MEAIRVARACGARLSVDGMSLVLEADSPPSSSVELASCTSSTLLATVQSLDGPDLRKGVGASEFAAVLDLSDLGGIEDDVDADIIVTAYAYSIATGNYSLSAHRIGAAGAAALARIAGRTQ